MVLPDLLSSQTYGCLPATRMAEWAGNRLSASAMGSLECTDSPLPWREPCGVPKSALPAKSCLEMPPRRSQSTFQRIKCMVYLSLTSFVDLVPKLKGFGKLCAQC